MILRIKQSLLQPYRPLVSWKAWWLGWSLGIVEHPELNVVDVRWIEG